MVPGVPRNGHTGGLAVCVVLSNLHRIRTLLATLSTSRITGVALASLPREVIETAVRRFGCCSTQPDDS